MLKQEPQQQYGRPQGGGGQAAYGPGKAYGTAAPYAQSRSREELLRIGFPLVRRAAFRLIRRLPPNVEVDDLIGAGNEGLLRAIASYNPKVHPQFEPYANARIRGSMLDSLRASDPITRHGRKRMNEVSAAIRKLEHELGRPPEEEEIAASLSISLDQYYKIAEDLARGPALAGIEGIDPDEVQNKGSDPQENLNRKELKEQIAQAIGSLPERSQLVLALYYQEDLTQTEIGEVLDLTESRVCQLLGESIARIRARLGVSPKAARQKKNAAKKKAAKKNQEEA